MLIKMEQLRYFLLRNGAAVVFFIKNGAVVQFVSKFIKKIFRLQKNIKSRNSVPQFLNLLFVESWVFFSIWRNIVPFLLITIPQHVVA